MTLRRWIPAVVLIVSVAGLCAGALRPTLAQGDTAGRATLVRVPDGGIQPRLAVDGQRVHLVYFKGDAAAGDLFYTSASSGGPFKPSIRVNTRPASAIATGSVRGANLALGKDGRVHVAWMGSARATPRGPGDATPMMYTRLNDAGTAFEPERNVMQHAVGLDGGGTVAADSTGRVFVAWHAGGPSSQNETDRRVWVAPSRDDGKTFAREHPASPPETGACGCCGISALADPRGGLFVLYRGAAGLAQRDTYLLSSSDRGTTFGATKLSEWAIGGCPMSTFDLTDTSNGVFAAWETAGQVSMVRIGERGALRPAISPAPEAGKPTRRFPVVAGNARGETVMVWTEGTAWQRGGDVAWQIFNAQGAPTNERGRVAGVPVWSFAGVYAHPDGRFTIVY